MKAQNSLKLMQEIQNELKQSKHLLAQSKKLRREEPSHDYSHFKENLMSISNEQASLLDSSAMQGFNESSGLFVNTK